MSLGRFSNFAILENFCYRFLRNYETRKLKVGINMDNDLMYRVYRNRIQGSRALGVMFLDRFSKFKMHFAL